jgi:arginine-tRNA-protein transferase
LQERERNKQRKRREQQIETEKQRKKEDKMKPSTFVHILGKSISRCSYCHCRTEDTSVMYGFLCDEMSAADYELLTYRGWSRSGSYIYKPVLHETCCPLYVIRLKVNEFQPTKSQKKVLKRMEKFENSFQENKKNEITIEIEEASFSEEKYRLFREYQIAIHHDDPEKVTADTFIDFLVVSPLVDDRTEDGQEEEQGEESSRSSPLKCGTYHQLYHINGKLAAVGVLDVIPSGIISVYCFYDPALREELVLGKYSILKEIEFCQTMGFDYYYLGYFTPSCAKVSYKGDFSPSELLCPSTLSWVSLDDSIRSLITSYGFTPLCSSSSSLLEKREEIEKTVFPSKEEKRKVLKELVFHEETKAEEEKEAEEGTALLFSPEEVPLSLGSGEIDSLVFLSLFPSHLQQILLPVLEEWIEMLAGSREIAKRFIVTLR